MILLGYVLSFVYAAVVLLVGALSYKLGLAQKYSRKIIHILVGFEWFILSYTHGATVHFLAVCLVFLAFLALVYHKKWLAMMSSSSDNSKGTVYYAVSMSVMAAVSFLYAPFLPYFGIAVLATSIGDGLGGVVGQALKQSARLYKNKTPLGTLAVFLSTLLSVFLFSRGYGLPLTFLEILAIAILATGVELLSCAGLDNIFVPLATSAFAFLLSLEIIDTMKFALAFIPLLVAIFLERKKLTRGGVIAAALLDILIALAFGDRGFCILIVFFALSLIADKVKSSRSSDGSTGECRGVKQVFFNSVFGALCALSYLIFSHKYFLFLFLLSFAEALGDTVASGFGALASKTYDIFRRRTVQKGESGGVSLVGTIAAMFFTLTFVSLGGILFSLRLTVVVTIFLCAILGVFFDTFLGSTVQLRFYCEECKQIVEVPKHCNKSAKHCRGFYPFDNSFVNLISGAFSVTLLVISIFLFSFF